MAPRFASRCEGRVDHDLWAPKEAPAGPSDIGRIESLGRAGIAAFEVALPPGEKYK